ncbi:MAG: guanylate kinase [Pseudomonadota bacterium]
MNARRGLLIILSSPSGAGKSTLARRLLARDVAMEFSVSATTRPPRPGEVDGQHYHFLDQASFDRMVTDGEMLEHAVVFGRSYGSPRAPVEAAVGAGRDVIFDVDWQGGQQIRNSSLGADAVSIFLLPPSIAALEERLRARAQDAEAEIARRMEKSLGEIVHWDAYDYVLINEDLDRTEDAIRAIVAAERLRRLRRPGLADFVRGLEAQFKERTP